MTFSSVLKFKVVGNGRNDPEKGGLNRLRFEIIVRVLLEKDGVGIPPVISIINGEGPAAFEFLRSFFSGYVFD